VQFFVLGQRPAQQRFRGRPVALAKEGLTPVVDRVGDERMLGAVGRFEHGLGLFGQPGRPAVPALPLREDSEVENRQRRLGVPGPEPLFADGPRVLVQPVGLLEVPQLGVADRQVIEVGQQERVVGPVPFLFQG